MKKLITVCTAAAVIGSASMSLCYADSPASKEEVIYGNLSHDGSVEQIYAVNIFDSDTVTDYGRYSNVKNLTTEDKITLKDDTVSVHPSETPFYYEGTLEDAELPWDIDIIYKLDGRQMDASELAGLRGNLEIIFEVERNDACDDFFYDNYALQITAVLDGNYCRNITAEDATIANVGSDKQITYTVLPGKGMSGSITAEVSDFEMDEITINGISLNLNIDIDDEELLSAARNLEDGTGRLNDGVGNINDAAGQLYDGAEELSTGAGQLAENVSVQAYKSLMKQKALDVDSLNQSNAEMISQLESMLSSCGDSMELEQKKLYSQMISLLKGNSAAIKGTDTYLENVSSQLSALNEGAAALSEGAEELKKGTSKLSDGASQLHENVSGTDERISDEIDKITSEMTGSDEVRSFISSKNNNVSSVQFVLRTEPVKKEEVNAESEEKEEPGLLEKFINLFR